MRELVAGFAAIALLCGAYAASAAPAPGSVETVQPPASPPPAATPPAATPPAAAPSAPAASVPAATDNRTPEGQARFITKKPKQRRYARQRYYGHSYYRRPPFYYAHPRFWWPFHPQRYRYYRHPRRHYYRPFWGW